MLVGIALYVGWDIYADVRGGPGATISEIALHVMWFHPGLSLIVGGLLGHLTWPSKNPPSDTIILVTGLPVVAIIAVLDILHVFPPMMPLMLFLAGMLLGHFVFPQKQKADEL